MGRRCCRYVGSKASYAARGGARAEDGAPVGGGSAAGGCGVDCHDPAVGGRATGAVAPVPMMDRISMAALRRAEWGPGQGMRRRTACSVTIGPWAAGMRFGFCQVWPTRNAYRNADCTTVKPLVRWHLRVVSYGPRRCADGQAAAHRESRRDAGPCVGSPLLAVSHRPVRGRVRRRCRGRSSRSRTCRE
jgi:hypothetical protein